MPTPINLYYIRAAVESATGIRLTLARTREYLVEEGLITQAQADQDAQEFHGYQSLYRTDGVGETSTDDPQDIKDDIDRALKIMENQL